jgi:hypothetical protein
MNEDSNIHEFGELLVRLVRDHAIRSADDVATNPNGVSPIYWRWKNAENMLSMAIPDTIDETLFHLLHAIDNGLIQLSFRNREGKLIDLSDGSFGLAGWYVGHWRAQFSQERVFDDFSDITYQPSHEFDDLDRPFEGGEDSK